MSNSSSSWESVGLMVVTVESALPVAHLSSYTKGGLEVRNPAAALLDGPPRHHLLGGGAGFRRTAPDVGL